MSQMIPFAAPRGSLKLVRLARYLAPLGFRHRFYFDGGQD